MTDTLTVRPAGPGDAPDICALLNAVDVIEIGRPETDLGTVEADLNHPDVDLATDSWLAFRGGRLVAYAMVWSDAGPGRVDGDHYVLPGDPEAAVRLLELMEARARAMAAGSVRPGLRIQLNAEPTLDLGILTRRGYRTLRHYQVMTRRLTPADAAPPTPPAGLTLRHCGTDEADRRRAHALVEETFAAHFGHVDRPYEAWLDHLDARDLDCRWCGSPACPARATRPSCSPATTAPAWAGSATSACARACAAAASAASCSATSSPPTPPAAATRWASEWTPPTKPAHSGSTRRTACDCTTPSTPGSCLCTLRGDSRETRGCNRSNRGCAGTSMG